MSAMNDYNEKKGMQTDMILYETPVKYERWVKFVIALPAILLVVAGLVLSRIVHIPGVNPSGSGRELHIVSTVFFATAPFILFIYWLVLPTRISIHQDKMRVKFGRFFWTIRFETIESVRAASGFPPAFSHSSVTSYRNQVEIVRKSRMPVRLSPENRDEFLGHIHRALSEWKRAHEAHENR